MTAPAASSRSPTPRTISPYNLMQEAYRDDPWALLVGCILFNMVHGSKARPVLEEFLLRWPIPIWLLEQAQEDQDLVLCEMRTMFKPLGFQNRRADRVLFMTCDYCDSSWNGDPLELHGIGKYGADSFNIFCRGYLVEDVQDKELRNYVRWASSAQTGTDGGGARGVLQAHPGPAAEKGGGDAKASQSRPKGS